MLRLFDRLAAAVSRRPVVVLLLVLLVTGGLGYLNGQMVQDDSFAVENEVADALATIDDTFSDAQSVLQVVVSTTDGSDVRAPEPCPARGEALVTVHATAVFGDVEFRRE